MSAKSSHRKGHRTTRAEAQKANLAGHKKHPKGKQTATQLAAEKSSLKIARSVQGHTHRTATAAQKAADDKNLAKARAAKKGKPLTAKELAADRANLAKARAVLKAEGKSWTDHTTSSWKAYSANNMASLAKYRGTIAARRAQSLADLHNSTHHPLGSHLITFHEHAYPSHRKPTGIPKSFRKRIAPSSFNQRTGWKSSHAHHKRHRLYVRKFRGKRVKLWRKRSGRLRPR